MESVVVGFSGLAIVFLLIFFGLPVGFAFLLVGVGGLSLLIGMNEGVSILSTSPFETAANYFFGVLPCFVFMALLCEAGGFITEVYSVGYKWLGHLPGGLAMATISASTAHAAVSGDGLSTAAIFSRVAFPQMRKYNYDDSFAAGTIASGGTLGILIPPSMGLILYGIITETSIGKLFIAGILPGILLAFLFMALIYTRVKLNPSLGMPGPKARWNERLLSLKGAWPILTLFIVVIGGIYAGIFTPTEGGAVGAFVAFLITLSKRRLTIQGLFTCLKDTIRITGMIFIILIGALVFNYFMTVTGLPTGLANLVSAVGMSPYLVLLFVVLILLALGAIMEEPPMILLTMPILFPIATSVGLNPIWFGVIVTLLCEAGMILPPVGINVFVTAGIIKDVPLFSVYRGAFPFFLAILVCIGIITLFPQIALFLPSLMY